MTAVCLIRRCTCARVCACSAARPSTLKLNKRGSTLTGGVVACDGDARAAIADAGGDGADAVAAPSSVEIDMAAPLSRDMASTTSDTEMTVGSVSALAPVATGDVNIAVANRLFATQ